MSAHIIWQYDFRSAMAFGAAGFTMPMKNDLVLGNNVLYGTRCTFSLFFYFKSFIARHAVSISFSVISCNQRRRIFLLFLVSDIRDRTHDVVRVF